VAAKPCNTNSSDDLDYNYKHDKNEKKTENRDNIATKTMLNKETKDPSFKSKAPTNLLIPPPQQSSNPGDISNTQDISPHSPKTPRSPKAPKSPRSPSLMKKFQVVKSGLQFVSHMKPTDKTD